jgi:hypothetical protein
VELLHAAKTPFALAGRLAVWHYVPAEGQQFTRDVDFAVPYGHVEPLARLAAKRGYALAQLYIGGIGIKAPGIAIDFVDRRRGYTDLFADAVKAAQAAPKLRLGALEIPVVPRDYLIAMKLIVFESDDERDLEELLMVVSLEEYAGLRQLVTQYLGDALAERLDAIARRVGHPGPGMKSRRRE